jgi:type IV pilus assembly protein PilO
MAIKIGLDKLPPYVKVLIPFVVSVIIIGIFVYVTYIPKNKEINSLNAQVSKLDSEIANGEVKVRMLETLKAENAILKLNLKALQEQLPEGKEVSILLKQISDLGVTSGLDIILWKPGARKISQDRLYAEIPVQVQVATDYHNLGSFFSYISRLKRIVNITGITIKQKKISKAGEGKLTDAKFTAVTFGALTPEEMAASADEN